MNFDPTEVDAFFSGTNAVAKAAQNICGAVATCTDQLNDSRRNFGTNQSPIANGYQQQVQVQPQMQYQHQPITYGYGYADDTPFQPLPNTCYEYGYNNLQPQYVYQTPVSPPTYTMFPSTQQAMNWNNNIYPGIYDPGYGKGGGGMW